ncbi:MAG TPA: PEP-utilizing enzyme [Actinomycetes bacterium]|nr:PEP-utilizing enzyme [Actinomycetes bacterium]
MTSTDVSVTGSRFPSPFEVPTPPGAEGWQRMYPWYLQFSQENREFEDSVLWFQDGMHHPEVEFPFDTITHECWRLALGQYNSRVFAVPPAYGIEQRILNGYLYITPIPVTDEQWMGERVAAFTRRAGYYYQNWDRLFEQWKTKMTGLIGELKAVDVPALPRLDDEEVVTRALGTTRGYRLLEAYDHTLENLFLAWQYHFEMLNLGYAAYLNLFRFARQAFPGIRDETLAQMVAGADILFFRPDDELKRLAQLALELGVADQIRAGGRPEATVEALRATERGCEWVQAMEAVKDPWFHFSNGAGFYHHHRSWIDDLTIPWAALTGYIDRLERGERLDRPRAEVLERRERLTAEYRELLATDEDRTTFDQNIGLARTVATYIEDHNFYVEHWHHTIWWNKIREFGDRLVEGGWLDERDDMFYLNRWELGQALYELVACWATGAPSRGPHYWKAEVADRRRIVTALRAQPPAPALGPVPEEISEPFTVMLWGITTERVRQWLGAAAAGGEDELRGVAGSPGQVEGRARVILAASQLGEVEQGEILICPITAPSWGPVFGKIGAAVSDIGGIMSHAAIVSREFGLPAVVGTGSGTKRVRTGDRVRVDGDTGVVTILERAGRA